MSKPVAASIPVFKLYGENQDWIAPDLLHCETIPKRSRLHHWEIQPHRHADLCQLLFLHKGEARVDIEGQRSTLRESAIQVVPPLCVHGFQFSENIDGYVLTLASPLVTQLQAQLGSSPDALAVPASYPAGHDRVYLHRLFSALQSEYAANQPARDMLLRSLVSVLLVWLSRQVIHREAAGQLPERGREYLSRFSGLVEAQFRQHPSVEQLSHQVGISVAHLNSICREWAGQSALQMIHQRLLLEAKRNLIYTRMSISRVADELGFADSAYFARFFRRMTGLSPSAFRADLDRQDLSQGTQARGVRHAVRQVAGGD
ncbi:helix-turn-helix domain-containing protein [Pseudomonas fuscovaginae UPB0736]|uniref:helix-turn-helix domain-containing protein n=1 Tax=Pseudomonas asplenii TaxID=53407 RepID=UPI0002883AF6|nr:MULTISPECIES: helix-turn-helix domain-containing protein [Pseudomonas]UUQ66249.1 helix-turn-helix domain-containing protein [Pseudomonas fuscovaginae UPB0736]UZE30530.1 helix-turn-helix domain-containing protein [Pseudomonas asplenii]